MKGIRNAAIALVVFGISALGTPTHAASGASKTSASGNNQAQAPSTGTNASPSNAPFEAAMLAYGAVDQVMHALATKVCSKIPTTADPAPKPLVLVVDQSILANVAAYDGFIETARLLTSSFDPSVEPQPPPGGRFMRMFGTVTSASFSAVFGTVAASTVDTTSSVSIQDMSAELGLVKFLESDGEKAPCKGKRVEVQYGGVYAATPTLPSVEKALFELNKARAKAISNVASACVGTNPCWTPIGNLDTTYQSFLQSLWASNATTGQPSIVQILQGYRIANAIEGSKSRDTFLVFVNVASAGGTERDVKNLITFVLTGDWIYYSGGVVVNALVTEYKTDDNGMLKEEKITLSDVFRYRTPLKASFEPPATCDSCTPTNAGDNLNEVVR